MDACFGCPVRCKKRIEVKEGPYKVDPAYGGPEYETLAALGSDCGITDAAAISLGNQLCGSYGLDTISTGGSIAFAMECFERGLLTRQDTDGLELRFGNVDAMLKSIDLIARHQGIGKLMGEGTKRMAEKIVILNEREATKFRSGSWDKAIGVISAGPLKEYLLERYGG